MYSIDINFLHDRPDYKPAVAAPKTPTLASGAPVNQTPMLIGVGIALALNAAVGGVWFWLTQQNAKLKDDQAAVTTTLNNQNSKVLEVKQIDDRTAKIKSETDALASVFSQMKPWSALLQELSDRLPNGVQISTITQTEPSPSPVSLAPSPSASAAPAASSSPGSSPSPSASPTPAASAPPAQPVATAKLELSGVASSFAQVNDFVVLLRRSPFFKANDTKLVAATLKENSAQLQLRSLSDSGSAADLPKLRPVVEYKIETNLSDAPASELLPQLKQNGAQGLAIRIETLQEQGVLEQPKEVKKP